MRKTGERMKRPLSFFIAAAFISLSIISLSGCEIVHLNDIPEETTIVTETQADIVILPPEPDYPYIADIKSERLLDIDASRLADIDYDGATIEYVYSTEFTEYIIDEMRGQAAETFLKYLKRLNASDQKGEDFKQLAGVGYHNFRITLSTGEKIYLGIESGWDSNVFLNNTPYECYDNENRNKLTNFIKKGYTPPDSLIPNADRTKEINGAELAALNFDGASVEYIDNSWLSCGGTILEKLPAEDAVNFFEWLNASEISSEPDNNAIPVSESSTCNSFRITLNDNTKVFVHVACTAYPDHIIINDKYYSCDEETVKKLSSMPYSGTTTFYINSNIGEAELFY